MISAIRKVRADSNIGSAGGKTGLSPAPARCDDGPVAPAALAFAAAVAGFELQPRRLVFSRADRLSGPLIAASLLAVTVVAALSSPRLSPALVLAAAVVVAVGVALRTAARRALGADYSYVACAPGVVCTRGPYKYIRHPAYLGTSLYAFATPLGFASPAAALLVPLVLLAVLYRIRLEEALLEATRPAYAEYVRRTAALIPFVL